MKNREFIIVTVLCSLLLISLNSHSQFTCGGAYPSEEIVPDGSCSFASSSYDNKYNDLSFYIPDENTPIKTILVNINICASSK